MGVHREVRVGTCVEHDRCPLLGFVKDYEDSGCATNLVLCISAESRGGWLLGEEELRSNLLKKDLNFFCVHCHQ